MTDRTKVLKAFEHCLYKFKKFGCDGCPLQDEFDIKCDGKGDVMPIKLCNNVLKLLKDAPDIVRCKDCKHSYFADNRMIYEQSWVCGKTGSNITADWFCADGERREEDV